jgi:hypothetical protein
MRIADDFREQVLGALTCLQNRGYIPQNADDNPESDEWDHLCDWIGIKFGWEGLLEKTPIHPPELRVIAQEIRQLHMVQAMIGNYPHYRHSVPAVCQRELPILIAKLKELLEYLPEPTLPTAPPQNLQRKSRGPHAAMAKHEKIAAVVASFGGDWKQENNLDQIAAQLDRQSVPVSEPWLKHKPSARTWGKAVIILRQAVVKTIEYSLRMVKMRN